MKLENLELVEVVKNEELTNVQLFFQDENSDQYIVKFNKLDYNNGQWVKSAEKEAKTNKNLKEHLGYEYDEIEKAIGIKKDIWVYLDVEKPYCALWESNSDYPTYAKPDLNFNKTHKRGVDTVINRIYDSGKAIICDFEIEGQLYKAQNYITMSGKEQTLNYTKWEKEGDKWVGKTQGIKKSIAQKIFKDELNSGEGMEGKQIVVYPKSLNDIVYLQFELASEIYSEQEGKWDL